MIWNYKTSAKSTGLFYFAIQTTLEHYKSSIFLLKQSLDKNSRPKLIKGIPEPYYLKSLKSGK